GVERGAAVGRRNDDGDTGFADVHVAEAMDNGNGANIPGLSDKNSNLFQLLERHRIVGFVDQMKRALSFGVVPNNALANTNRTVLGTEHLTRNLLCIDRLPGDLIQLILPTDRQNIRPDISTTHRRKNSEFISFTDSGTALDVFFIEGRQYNRAIFFNSRIP